MYMIITFESDWHNLSIAERRRKMRAKSSSMTTSSTISTKAIESIIHKLRNMCNRSSTRRNYLCIWKNFNQFIIKLDNKPRTWEQRLTLFVGYLIDAKKKSTTIKSYISAIKSVLLENDLQINKDSFLLASLTRTCRMVNDHVTTRLPIHRDLLAMLLNKIDRYYDKQPFLRRLYCVIFVVGYFGLLRIGELVNSPHAILAKDVHIAKNKAKLLFILRSSKTHDKSSKPQYVKITGDVYTGSWTNQKNRLRMICPFSIVRSYLEVRGKAKSLTEQFFTFSDGSPVNACNVRSVLKMTLTLGGIDPELYSCHSLRIGRASDLLKLGCSVETIKKLGRWRSNAVFCYLC